MPNYESGDPIISKQNGSIYNTVSLYIQLEKSIMFKKQQETILNEGCSPLSEIRWLSVHRSGFIGNPGGAKSMFTLYRTHEQQLRTLMEDLNSFYKKTKSNEISLKPEIKTDNPSRIGPDFDGISSSHEFGSPIIDKQIKKDSNKRPWIVPVLSKIPIRRCIRCDEGISTWDFLYTEMSGYCISCWEGIFFQDESGL